MTIKIYGTSHVSQESIEVIDQAFLENPDIIALELDPPRLEALMFGGRGSNGSVFIRLLERFQKYIGGKTGLMPGEEMLYAYKRGIQENLDVALVDRDIRVTVKRLKKVRRKEKVKAFFSLFAGFLVPFGSDIDLGSIPEEHKIRRMVSELESSFPEIYRILMDERNRYICSSLVQLQKDNPDDDVAVFLGAAHCQPVYDLLRGEDVEVYRKGILEER